MVGSNTFATVKIKFSFGFAVIVELGRLVTVHLFVFSRGRADIAIDVPRWLLVVKLDWSSE